jgi:hypothetical protein
LGRIRVPLPEHYLLGFDEQKIETEGVPLRYFAAARKAKNTGNGAVVDMERRTPQTDRDAKGAYSVYLNGEMRTTGWGTYYLQALLYKVPEGTWLLVASSLAVLFASHHSRLAWFDELAPWAMPVVILLTMSLLTDINLGLRYVLAILPYVFISTGKVVPWCSSLGKPWRWVAGGFIGGSLGLTIAASAWIHPSYLAYFNWASGGPDRIPPRLIDSNLDWGQDLVALQRWWRDNIPDQPIGLAYFGQINPSIFAMRGEPFRWFLPPARAGTISRMPGASDPRLEGPAPKLTPGYYAVSATLLYGLPWRLYDPMDPRIVPAAWAPVWNAHGFHAYGYFRRFTPIKRIGHSFYVYRLTQEDIAQAARDLEGPAR